MDEKKLEELRDYYDCTDTSAEIANAELDDEIVISPMVGITVRLPAEVLQRVRDLAAQENVKTTALIRRWIECEIESEDELAPAAARAWSKSGVLISASWSDVPEGVDYGEAFGAIVGGRTRV